MLPPPPLPPGHPSAAITASSSSSNGMEERPQQAAAPSSSRTGALRSGMSSSSPPSTPDIYTPDELSRAVSPAPLRPPHDAAAASGTDAPAAAAPGSTAPTNDELEAFRRAWQSEVSERKRATAAPPAQPPPAPPPPADSSDAAPQRRNEEHGVGSDDEEAAPDDEQPHSHVWPAAPSSPQRPRALTDRALAEALLPPLPAPTLSPELIAARAARAREHAQADAKALETEKGRREMEAGVRLYARGVGAERRGDTDEAIQFYRRAFRLYEASDRLYQRAVVLLSSRPADDAAQPIDPLLSTEEVVAAVCSALETSTSDATRSATRSSPDVPRAQNHAAPVQSGAVSKRLPLTTPAAAPPASVAAILPEDQPDLAELLAKLALAAPSDDADADAATPAASEEIPGLRARFTPEDEEQPVLLDVLPDELLLLIFAHLAAPRGKRGARIAPVQPGEPPSKRGIGVVLAGPDWMSLESAGRACVTFRRLTAAWSIWRDIARHTYFVPQLPAEIPCESLPELLALSHWRDVFVAQPRVRLNGCYIAACHYTRQGMHPDNRWVQVVHVVEFYRSLRFLPDGRALSLLTTDVPADTVRTMEPGLRAKGFAIGRWSLEPHGLPDDEFYGRAPGPKVVIDDLKDRNMEKYAFRMVFALRQTARGRWNKLEMLDYESVNLQTRAVCTIPQKHDKAFRYSAVRSYGV